MSVLEPHLAHHKHVQKLYEELLADVPGIRVHRQPDSLYSLSPSPSPEGKGLPVYDSNYWLTTISIDPEVRVKGQENAYKTMVTGPVGGVAGVIHKATSVTTDCQPNDNVEALRIALDQAAVESRPVWKPMHKQPVYASVPAYVNGVSESIFKVGMCLPTGPCVSDDDIRYIVDIIKQSVALKHKLVLVGTLIGILVFNHISSVIRPDARRILIAHASADKYSI